MAVDRLIWKILLDFFVLVCVSFPLLGILLWAEPYQRGYFQNDTSLMYPEKEETISVAVLAGGGFALVVVTIIILEVLRDRKGNGIGEKFLSGSVIPGWVWESYQTIGVFLFGASCQQLTCDLAKYIVGRLRPNFFAACRPFPVLGSADNALGYIQDYICAENDRNKVKEARLSFPSAHASFAMYCAVFFIFYLQVKGKWRGSKLLRHGLQYAVIIAAWYVGLTRVQNYFHHWGDVAVGFLNGAVFACLVFIYVLKPKKYSQLPMTTWEEPQPPITNALPRAVLAR